MREAELLEQFSNIALVELDAEPLGDDPLEVDPPPAHDAVDLAIRTRLDDLRELSQLIRRKASLGTLRPVVNEALRTRRVEAMDPVMQRSGGPCPDRRRCAAIHSIPDRSQRKKPPALVDALRLSGQRPKLLGRIVLSHVTRPISILQ
jgi:hypothetical protein